MKKFLCIVLAVVLSLGMATTAWARLSYLDIGTYGLLITDGEALVEGSLYVNNTNSCGIKVVLKERADMTKSWKSIKTFSVKENDYSTDISETYASCKPGYFYKATFTFYAYDSSGRVLESITEDTTIERA